MRAIPSLIGLVLFSHLSTGWTDAIVFPNKPVTLIVPFTPGGGADIVARLLAKKLTEEWKQPVIVENKAGATGTIAALYVAKAPPDGYTLLVGTTSTHTLGPQLFKRRPYDPANDFKPVSLVAWAPLVLVTAPSSQVKANTVDEFIAYLKANPGKVSFASSGKGSILHMAGLRFSSMAGVDMHHIPYRGASAAVTGVLGGHVDVMFDSIASSLPHVRGGQLRALGVTKKSRSNQLPAVPTVSESSLPKYSIESWIGFLAPAATPDAVIGKIQQDLVRVLKHADVKASFDAQAIELAGTTAHEFGEVIRDELNLYSKELKAAGIDPE